jgi:hypothetical protein
LEEHLSSSGIVRHGAGDGVVTLNVGGKEFITLRSTLEINPILHNRVCMAEANQEFTNGAVFIDRDPAQFGLILQHLRNRADMVSSHSMSQKYWKKNQVLIQFPQDKGKARDLFVEARYFQIKELVDSLCHHDLYTQIAAWIGGGSVNPFHAASETIQTVRRAIFATGGIGMIMGSQNGDLMNDIKALMGNLTGKATGRMKEASSGTPKTDPKPSAEASFS